MLVAEVHGGDDTCAILFDDDLYHGIRRGIVEGDLGCHADERTDNTQHTGTNPGEFYLDGTYFVYTRAIIAPSTPPPAPLPW